MLRVVFAGLVGGVLALVAADSRASLHHPDGGVAAMIPVDESGAPAPYPFDEFKRRRLELRNIGNPEWPLEAINPVTKEKLLDPKTKQPLLSDRGKIDARIKKAQEKPAEKRTDEEKVALAIDLLRFRRPDDAEGALRGLRRGFLPNITLAHIAATQGQWSRAYEYLDIANEETPPASLNPKSPKIAWQLKTNRSALRKFIKLRLDESRTKPPPENELPDELWPIKFVNDKGEYEPGALAAAEKAKLPGGDFGEAIATVQQLVLWFPDDIRLYWLLGELYAAKGEVRAAREVMNECVDSGRYSNRKALMQHREVVAKAVAALPPEPQPPEHSPPPEVTETEPAVPFTMTAVWWYFGAVVVLGLLALVRAIFKRRKSASA